MPWLGTVPHNTLRLLDDYRDKKTHRKNKERKKTNMEKGRNQNTLRTRPHETVDAYIGPKKRTDEKGSYRCNHCEIEKKTVHKIELELRQVGGSENSPEKVGCEHKPETEKELPSLDIAVVGIEMVSYELSNSRHQDIVHYHVLLNLKNHCIDNNANYDSEKQREEQNDDTLDVESGCLLNHESPVPNGGAHLPAGTTQQTFES
jgi:hypothetical protein